MIYPARIRKKIQSILAGKGAEGRWLRRAPRVAGAFAGLVGLLIMMSWQVHWRRILQVLPDSAPMQFNTALCFVLFGAGLLLLTTSRPRIASWLGAAGALLPLLTLLEYLTGRDFKIDQLFFKPYFEVATTYPGRMSPLSAVCFILIGAGMILAQMRKTWPPRLAGTGLLACTVAVISCVALLGYGFGIEPAYGWGAYSRMALNTAAVFLVLSAGLLAWALPAARAENFTFLRWLPVSGSAALITMIAFVSATNMVELRKATFWRKHTVEVILSAQAFEENLIDMQRGARGYITLEDTNALAAFQASAQLEPQQFDQLAELTRDNPRQQQTLKKLAAAMEDVFSYDRRMIALCQQRGFQAAASADTHGESRAVFGNARNILRSFSQEERALLEVRSASEQADSTNTQRLLVFGCIMAVVLLVLANYMASFELSRRRRVEMEREKLIVELQRALAEVKTLSGLIPICAWCKSLRSDQGFWQSVEEYVRTRTDATFSHGMCPDCAQKVRQEMRQSP